MSVPQRSPIRVVSSIKGTVPRPNASSSSMPRAGSADCAATASIAYTIGHGRRPRTAPKPIGVAALRGPPRTVIMPPKESSTATNWGRAMAPGRVARPRRE
jgi:hypothetical protein